MDKPLEEPAGMPALPVMPPLPLLLGTANHHKVIELAELLRGLPWRIQSLADYPAAPSPVEDGNTFEANALTKARYFSQRFNVACVADDSGLVVDALGGQPGVFSARYAGAGCTDADNNAKLLAALAGVVDGRRTARFVCCAALAFPDGTEQVEAGSVEGYIAAACRGSRGFGYDPLFIPAGYEKTFGEFGLSEKQAISHRGRAFRKLRAHLETTP